MNRTAAVVLAVVVAASCGKDDNNVARTPDQGSMPQDMAMQPDMAQDASDAVDIGPDIPAEPGSLSVDPTSITFSDVRQGESETASVILSNLGGSPIVVTGVELVEENRTGEPEFSEGPEWDSSVVLGPNISAELQVVYEPKDFGIDRGFISLSTNDPDNERVTIRIETVSAYAQLEGPGLLRFGDVNVGDSLTKRITFYNRGLDSLTIDSVDLGGITGTYAIAFEPTATPPTVLERDEDFVIDVTYTPDADETHRGTVTINSDEPDEPTFDVALVGNDPTPCLDVTPGTVDFGEVAANAANTQQVTLLNCSQTLQVEISAIELADDGEGTFTLGDLPTLPLTLSPLQTAQFPVNGTLAQPGIGTGELTVTSTDPSGGTVPLRITVADP